ncbi:MAG: hypothetical protein EPN30_02420 [Actinomycetota bacterium]|nr:MAG: hypothetical protein EPN30_02420 [Actinomycetota bacterium]
MDLIDSQDRTHNSKVIGSDAASATREGTGNSWSERTGPCCLCHNPKMDLKNWVCLLSCVDRSKRSSGASESCGSPFRDDLVTWNKYEVSSKTFTGSARAADELPQNFIDMQVLPQSDGIGTTFGQLIDQWLEERERRDLSPTTMWTWNPFWSFRVSSPLV